LISILSDYFSLDRASIGDLGRLLLEGVARSAGECGASFHRPLERISFAAKDVVAMLSVAGGIGHTPNEWVRVTALPHAVERGGIPDDFVEKLRNADGVGRGAPPVGGIGNVALVVGTVKIGAIPASWEVELRTDTTWAGLVGHFICVLASRDTLSGRSTLCTTTALSIEAPVSELLSLSGVHIHCSPQRVASEHTESLLERGHILGAVC